MTQAFKLIFKTLQIGLASLIAVSNIGTSTIATQSSTQVPSTVADQAALSQTIPDNTVITMIREASRENGVDEDLSIAIARCESGLRQYDKDGKIVRGKVNPKDVGVFQINEDYQLRRSQSLGLDIYTTQGNIEYAMSLIKKSGNQPWSSSKSCWVDHVAMN